MNGIKCGEMAIDGGAAGDRDVPVIMVSGDDKCCKEARRFFRDVVTVQVKKGLDVEGGADAFAGLCPPPYPRGGRPRPAANTSGSQTLQGEAPR